MREVTKSCMVQINGSGDIKINEGAFQRLEAKIGGSGRIRVNASVQDADLRVSGSGTIKVDRVEGQLSKKSHHTGSIVVRQIGRDIVRAE
jgi:hypothetical protein